ncbi:uncharacterized oxidoreductase YjmC-like isoform X1 [Diorhabda carinulata]|uniref:uncharacterized oxidoreductase YjmC-like isoform X1 n=2 Tax=Diorhabda carinulata TaxID=1163345 RepID=UPI0025A079BF|nr:uncharacterized oxidoreductase YjmC-like isoform X1 [Diorhabda carinulata]XP_057662291.1 uncharacterized oxidoreductase YjmC-like isoform X1 [Diorhabda carinulata]XP_057662292.1 uncharacterized oxidoreductase YjmC-like isoform X1 [Diorhabda carinulata]
MSSGIKLLVEAKPLFTSYCRRRAVGLFHKKMSSLKTKEKPKITPLEESRRFMIDCFKAVGCNQNHAEIISANLLEADYRGHYSHGMNRLEMYINDVKGGLTLPNAVPTIEKETVATAVVNGNNGFGAVVGQYCMDVAIEKAAKAGIGLVVCHHSNHYGIAGMYALQAIKKGYIGFSTTNTSPLMVPTRAKQAALGTNPIALGVPALNGDSFVLDMATTAVALGKIEIARRKNVQIPESWALNEEGKVESDPDVAYNATRLLPLGGEELNSGYKGYGLGMFVEIFSGILSGSTYGPNIRHWANYEKEANLGQSFLAIDPNAFAPGVEHRMSDLMNHMRNMEPADPKLPVLAHGDPERIHMEKVHRDGGLCYVENQHETNLKLAKELNVSPMVSN